MHTVPFRQINQFVLRKQHLAPDTKTDDVARVAADIGGLHATNVTTPYLSLFARCRRFQIEDLDRELYVNKTLGKIRCMRKTIFVLPAEMLPIAYCATAASAVQTSRQYMEVRGVSEREYKKVSRDVLALLRQREMTASEVKKEIETDCDVSAILNLMGDMGLVIRGRPRSGWKDRNQHYALFSAYFPDMELKGQDQTEAIKRLVEYYLSALGPASEEDIAWWTGLGKTRVRAALRELSGQVTQIPAESGTRLILLGGQVDRLEHTRAPREPVVNLLPTLDPYVMGYKERARYLDPEHKNHVFDWAGNATSTILVDGRVTGIWDFQEDQAVVKLFLFGKPGRELLKRIHAAARQTGQFMARADVQVKECQAMIPLTDRPAGAMMAPLKYC